MTAQPRFDLIALALGVGFALIWSSAFSAAKFALAYAPPLTMLALRFALSGVIGVGVAAALGAAFPRERRAWMLIVVFGLCQNALYLGFNFVAMTQIPASLAAIIASALPLIVAASARALGMERLSALGALGLAVGFAGVTLIMGGRIAGGASALGVALCVAGVLALAGATLAVRGLGGVNIWMAVGLQMLVGAAALAPFALAFEDVTAIDATPAFLLDFLYIVLFPGLVATYLWFSLVARIGPTAASAFHFLNPVFGVAIAALALGEALGPWDLVGVAVVSAGIAAVQLSRRPARG